MRYLILSFLLAFVPTAQATTCRAENAAQAGSEAGYNRAKAAADAWALRQKNVTLSLGDCLGNISTTITSPVFPNLSDWLNQIEQKICKAARDKINALVPDNIDPWGALPSASLSSYSLQPVVMPTTTPAPAPQAVTTPAESPAPRSFISLN